MKLTPNERYLLEIIAYLRGTGCDLWGRLNAIREGEESVRRAAPKTELKALIDDLGSNRMGSHLPHPNDPQFSSELKHRLIGRHRRAFNKGQAVNNVYDLVPERERRRARR